MTARASLREIILRVNKGDLEKYEPLMGAEDGTIIQFERKFVGGYVQSYVAGKTNGRWSVNAQVSLKLGLSDEQLIRWLAGESAPNLLPVDEIWVVTQTNRLV